MHVRTKYNKAKENAKRKFKIKEGNIHVLEDLAKENPRKFWKALKKKKVKDNPESLNINDLCQHFKILFGETFSTNISGNVFVNSENQEIDIFTDCNIFAEK